MGVCLRLFFLPQEANISLYSLLRGPLSHPDPPISSPPLPLSLLDFLQPLSLSQSLISPAERGTQSFSFIFFDQRFVDPSVYYIMFGQDNHDVNIITSLTHATGCRTHKTPADVTEKPFASYYVISFSFELAKEC